MPPKGWRKDAQGNYPTTSYVKEQENITIQDLLFPRSSVVNIAKSTFSSTAEQISEDLNDNEIGDDADINNDNIVEENSNKILVSKDAGLALQRSSTVFVNHLLLFAREIAKDQYRKTCNPDDILNALDAIGHPGLKGIVSERLQEYQNALLLKKEYKRLHGTSSSDKRKDKDSGSSDDEENDDYDINEEGADQSSKKQRTDNSIPNFQSNRSTPMSTEPTQVQIFPEVQTSQSTNVLGVSPNQQLISNSIPPTEPTTAQNLPISSSANSDSTVLQSPNVTNQTEVSSVNPTTTESIVNPTTVNADKDGDVLMSEDPVKEGETTTITESVSEETVTTTPATTADDVKEST
ncbi:hypothetical protein TBLA_0H01430 [Henningerozyma blattae CBS 6284]|uniref:DNA polymerase epsilon subunit D n=1 Tax=Henningerozyma blattae (strain ATCC 34711 / CBS 6284 / DSM 70876 / NBRC 10599 / NRRL Y-10934 / UCD 77-7) TaxID=1071380 RepID=I2H7S8_HENB6|nr:hypothetical protein TBLA_0H01430 [Tetrapisispora blattae CBS 6284]CCH62430.1 hypothetical protein TBLA_0H01430 [Tetrapisispora blattae CBS 6284]